MSISEELLSKMMQEDFEARKAILETWTAVVEEELRTTEGVLCEKLYLMMYWAQTEYRRRRQAVGLRTQEEETRGCLLLKEISDRLEDAAWEKKKKEIEEWERKKKEKEAARRKR